MSAEDPIARLRAVGVVLTEKRPAVLAAVIAFLEAFIVVPTAPVALTAE